MQPSHKVSAVFDDPNLIGSAGLVPVMRLAERAGLPALLGQYLSVANPNAAVKAAGVIAGVDSIDDLHVLRHGGMTKVFDRVKAPSERGQPERRGESGGGDRRGGQCRRPSRAAPWRHDQGL
ncbi:MAG: hypothetical protein IPJ15_04945 [Actinomycetales bacterium]|nr:hypothetical protein [Candidatus Phosphoribacter baldrii]